MVHTYKAQEICLKNKGQHPSADAYFGGVLFNI